MWRRLWKWFVSWKSRKYLAVVSGELRTFRNKKLHGGFAIDSVVITEKLDRDTLGRLALAYTRTSAGRMTITLLGGMSEEEVSVSLYHEVLEAATVPSEHPPPIVMELNEAGFEDLARRFHARFGAATIESLNRMLQELGFPQ